MMLLSTATYSITNSKIFSIEEVEFPKEVPAIPNSMANRILEMACVLNYIKIISHKGRRAQALLPFILLKIKSHIFRDKLAYLLALFRLSLPNNPLSPSW